VPGLFRFCGRVVPVANDRLCPIDVFYEGANGDVLHIHTRPNGRDDILMLGPYAIPPAHNMTDWVCYRDRYDSGDYVAATRRHVHADALAETGS
jgi:hypothetical protein